MAITDRQQRSLALGVARQTPDRKVRVQALLGHTAWCSWTTHFALTLPPYTQGYEWAPAKSWLRIIISSRHWPPAYLRSWAEFRFAGEPAIVGDCQRWKYFMWTSSGPSAERNVKRNTRFLLKIQYFTDGMVEIRFCFSRQFELRWRPIADSPGTHQNRSPNVVSCNLRLRRR